MTQTAPEQAGARRVLAAALLALAALYLWRFHDDRNLVAALLVFVAPPLLLLVGVLRGSRVAGFWSGVLALLWFCHGVMLVWSEPGQRLSATLEIGLALLVVFASSWGGLRQRFVRRC